MVMLLIYWGEEWSLPGGHSWEARSSRSSPGYIFRLQKVL
jgi:hypothetical protein